MRGETGGVEVGVFGSLRKYMDLEGRPYRFYHQINKQGCQAASVASEIGLPVEEVEVVFKNGKVINMFDQIMPGDRISFFPFGTPGPYRLFLGIFRETRRRQQLENRD